MQDQEQTQSRQPDTAETAPKANRPKKHRPRRKPNNARPESGEKNTEQLSEATAPTSADGNREPSKNTNKPRDQKPGNKKNKNNRPQNQDGNTEERRNTQQNSNREPKKKRSQHNGNAIRTKRGLEDLYGTPTEDDVLTLEELRARIVLKAADGSVPSESAAPEDPAPAPSEEPVAEPSFDQLSPIPDHPVEMTETERVEVVGIRFRSAGKIYYFDPKGITLRQGDSAIVETARGPEFGEVSFGNRMVSKQSTVSPLRPVLRVATDEDIAHNAENREKEREALHVCEEKIAAHKLDMKLIDAQYAFDNSKLLFYFTSEGRVDFRDLVRDLASVFRTRIELRQIGIRDEAKMLGGLGACGRPLCCATFLPDFVQVSIKMAKEQNLSLNSAKISGVCGRLMCCLRYESDVYTEEIRKTPPYGSTVKTPDGIGTVIGINPLAGTVRVSLSGAQDVPPKQYSRDEVTVLSKSAQNSNQNS